MILYVWVGMHVYISNLSRSMCANMKKQSHHKVNLFFLIVPIMIYPFLSWASCLLILKLTYFQIPITQIGEDKAAQ